MNPQSQSQERAGQAQDERALFEAKLAMLIANCPNSQFEVRAPDGDYIAVSTEVLRATQAAAAPLADAPAGPALFEPACRGNGGCCADGICRKWNFRGIGATPAPAVAPEHPAVAALRGIEPLYQRDGESGNDTFERVAQLFHAETGYLRPGKDSRLHDPDERAAAWDGWISAKVAAMRAAIAGAPLHERDHK